MTEYTPTEPHPVDALSPENQRYLAEIALRSMRKHLRQAYDHATLLTDILQRERDRGGDSGEYDAMLAIVAEVGHAMSAADQWRWAEQEAKAA